MADTVTVTVGDIFHHFDLDTIGDAWVMVMDNDWPCERPTPGDETSGPWQVEVPADVWGSTHV